MLENYADEIKSLELGILKHNIELADMEKKLKMAKLEISFEIEEEKEEGSGKTRFSNATKRELELVKRLREKYPDIEKEIEKLSEKIKTDYIELEYKKRIFEIKMKG